MERFELNKLISQFSLDLQAIAKMINRDEVAKEISQIEIQMTDPLFWQNQEQSRDVARRQEFLKNQLASLDSLTKKVNDITELFLLLDSPSELEEIEIEARKISAELRHFKVKTLFVGEYDNHNAILEIHAGAGGTEAMDWAGMLMRMYQRFFDQNKYSYDLLEIEYGGEAGIKSCTFKVTGEFAFGYLKCESGVHRLVRISPYDSSKRRHTSFAAISVTPVIEKSSNIVINDKDIKIDTYHSSGAGGQSVNTTMSAVRVTHLPSGIVVTCQNERSQIQNKEIALKILVGKLEFLEKQKQDQTLQDIKGNIKAIEWGSQIRSYVFQPYQMVKDHRSNFETGRVEDVMNGDIINFIEEYLISKTR